MAGAARPYGATTTGGSRTSLPGAEDDAGFNRILQDDYGCRRHDGKANYVFADGHAGRYNANDIRCDEGECWWSLRLDAHARRVAAAFRAGGSAP